MKTNLGVVINLILVFLVMPQSHAAESLQDFEVNRELIAGCDDGLPLTTEERRDLISKLRISKVGQTALTDFVRQYASLSNLVIQWDQVSYSQVAKTTGRSIASLGTSEKNGSLGAAICVHLARKLPEIEHIADLAHEITHATRLEMKILKGEVQNVDEFVKVRLGAQGGEADAFSVECQVKREILGHWDSFCAPYTSKKQDGVEQINTAAVVEDLYNGKLSASLTGEAYPIMLGRQYKALLEKKRAMTRYSALENK